MLIEACSTVASFGLRVTQDLALQTCDGEPTAIDAERWGPVLIRERDMRLERAGSVVEGSGRAGRVGTRYPRPRGR